MLLFIVIVLLFLCVSEERGSVSAEGSHSTELFPDVSHTMDDYYSSVVWRAAVIEQTHQSEELGFAPSVAL